MGEMADMAMEDYGSIISGECDWGAPSDYHTPTKTCRCCGVSSLTWGHHNGKWRLFERDYVRGCVRLHNCPVNPLRGA